MWYVFIGLLLAATGPPSGLTAQVGHRPEASPYRPILARRIVSITSGYLWGDVGNAGVAPTNGPLVGVRLDLLFGGAIDVSFNISYAALERLVIDPSLSPAERKLGIEPQAVTSFEGAFHLLLTGGKTWHNIAPYVGFGIGLSFGNTVPEEPSTYSFGTKLLIAPQAGFRLFMSQRITLVVEARDTLWRLKYPPTYFGAIEPVLDPDIFKAEDWTHHLTLSVSLGYVLGF